jgi:hypothetical protein
MGPAQPQGSRSDPTPIPHPPGSACYRRWAWRNDPNPVCSPAAKTARKSVPSASLRQPRTCPRWSRSSIDGQRCGRMRNPGGTWSVADPLRSIWLRPGADPRGPRYGPGRTTVGAVPCPPRRFRPRARVPGSGPAHRAGRPRCGPPSASTVRVQLVPRRRSGPCPTLGARMGTTTQAPSPGCRCQPHGCGTRTGSAGLSRGRGPAQQVPVHHVPQALPSTVHVHR